MPARHGGAVVLATVEVEAEESLERTSSRLVYQDADLKKKRRRKERDRERDREGIREGGRERKYS